MAALLLSTISIAAQVLYLELDALKGAVSIPAGALDNVPIAGWLVVSNGPGWVVLGRAIGFHVAEAACCFILAKSTQNPEKRMLAMQREQRAVHELQRFERIAALERRIARVRVCGVRQGGAAVPTCIVLLHHDSVVSAHRNIGRLVSLMKRRCLGQAIIQ